MSSGSARPDPEPSRHAAHRHGRDTDRAAAAPADETAWFAVVLRGYDRSQVESRLAELDRRIHEEIRRAEAAESSLGATRAHVRRLQEQLAQRTTALAPPVTPAGGNADFGHRLERVLQAAEQEAAELREKALADAEQIRSAARTEAEAHRRRTEEALLGRAAVLDREFTARSADLDERERAVSVRVESAHDEATELRERARTELDRARDEAARLRGDAERFVDDRRAGISRDVERLSSLRDEVRGELSRVRERLTAELDREPVAAVLDDALFGPYSSSDTVDTADTIGTADTIDTADAVDTADATDSADVADSTDVVDAVDSTRTVDAAAAGSRDRATDLPRVTGGVSGAGVRPGAARTDRSGGAAGVTGTGVTADAADGAGSSGGTGTTDGTDDADDTDDRSVAGTLLLGPGRLPGRGSGATPEDDETTIGRIPPISLASIGVLPFGDLTAGGDTPRTRTDGTNGASRGHRGPTRGPGPGRRSR